ncbi:hypothetical protein CJ030_MR6G023569 [Morella rubra]|uniref:Myb/SANT-like domain-containing protein n=1 Tax=Morella rubra TaxID=262757 RepID=A0A6A1VG08_9ROSI|nr:hypothetical protein CJ030_MR6G023569 [Morella rubra]
MSKSFKKSHFGSPVKSESATSPPPEIIIIPDSPAISILSVESRNHIDPVNPSSIPFLRARRLVLRDDPTDGCSETAAINAIHLPLKPTPSEPIQPILKRTESSHQRLFNLFNPYISIVAPETRSASLARCIIRKTEENGKLAPGARQGQQRHRLQGVKSASRKHKMEGNEILPSVKVAWPPRHIRILINLLVHEVTKGKMNNGQIGRHSWKRITSNLEAQANHAYSLKQVKGKFNRLRILHREFSTLLRDPTGFGWDPETNTVTASEEAWQKHLNATSNSGVKANFHNNCPHIQVNK